MINVTVINLKNISKYLMIALIIGCIFVFVNSSKNKGTLSKKMPNISLIKCLEETLPNINEGNEYKELNKIAEISSDGSYYKKILEVELPIIDKLIIDEEDDKYIKENEENNTEKEEKEEIEVARTDVTTEEIQENNIESKYNCVFGSVKVKNESSKDITEEILTPNISLENNKDILIFHTHTCESYTPSENFNYTMTGTYRTTDLKYTVAGVGEELVKQLTGYGYNVTHNQTYHDYPEYSGSYGRSLATVEKMQNEGCKAQMIIDLHRDAIR